jgi:stage V sporulation protein G
VNITNVEIILPKSTEKLLAYVTITVDDMFVVKDIRIINGKDRLVVAMPDKQRSTPCEHCSYRIRQWDKFCPRCGKPLAFRTIEFVDVCHPINNDCRVEIDRVVLEKYQCVLTASMESQPPLTESNSLTS